MGADADGAANADGAADADAEPDADEAEEIRGLSRVADARSSPLVFLLRSFGAPETRRVEEKKTNEVGTTQDRRFRKDMFAMQE